MTKTLDRFGNPIRVAFSTTELLWIMAANSLPPDERTAALDDIASMTARSPRAIAVKARELLQKAPEVPAPPPPPKVRIGWAPPPTKISAVRDQTE